MQREGGFVLTDFLCDVIDWQEGRITRDDLRARWKAGKYRGVNPEYAKWQMGVK